MKHALILITFFIWTANLLAQSTELYNNDFSNLNGLTLYGSPLPQHFTTIKGRSGVFDNNGDPNYNSGAITQSSFSISSGFVLESEVYLDFTDLSGCWAGAAIGIANPTYQSWGGYDSYISITLQANGDACWGSPPGTRRRAVIGGGHKTSAGSESFGDLSVSPIYADAYANTWVTLKIVVDQNKMAKYYINNNLIYTATQQVDPAVMNEARKIWLGDRSSGSAGKAYHDWVKLSTITTSVDLEEVLDKSFTLFQNYPNPFNPSTTISFSLPVHSPVNLKIYDILGNEISNLINEDKSPGTYSVNFSGENLPSGIYFYQLTAGKFREVKKMLLLK